MACQFINGTSWYYFSFFDRDFPMIKVNAKGNIVQNEKMQHFIMKCCIFAL